MADNIERIKRESLSELIGRDVELEKKGQLVVGLCPFHDDRKSKSLTIFDDQNFHCFGCSTGGDAITYMQLREKLPDTPEGKNEAIQKCLAFYGIQRKETGKNDSPDIVIDRQKARRMVQERLHKALLANEDMMKYLSSRDVTEDDVRLWGMGCGTGSLAKEFSGRISKKVLEDIGVLGTYEKKSGKTGNYEYIKKGWLTVPVTDARGRISHWWLRDIDDKNNRQMYMKNREREDILLNEIDLIGEQNLKEPTEENQCYLVEGFFEACQLKKRGLPVAAFNGKGSRKQLDFILNLRKGNATYEELQVTKELYIWMDRDKNKSGQIASEQIATELYVYFKVFIVKVPQIGMDPDDFFRAGGSIEEVRKIPFTDPRYHVEPTPMGYLLNPNGKRKVPFRLTNFTMDIMYHFVSDNSDRTRMVRVNRNGHLTRQLMMSGEDIASRHGFQKWLSKKTKDCVLRGEPSDFEELMEFTKETDMSKTIKFSRQLGNIAPGTWLYDDGAIHNGHVLRADSDGITWIPIDGYEGVRTSIGTELEQDKGVRLSVPEQWMSFEEVVDAMLVMWPQWMVKIMIGFAIATIFRDTVIGYYGVFAHLFMRGGTGQGKTKATRFIRSLFNADLAPTDTCDSTNPAIARHLMGYRNLPHHLTEYEPKFEAMLKNIFDQNLRSWARMTTGNETQDPRPETSVIFTCQTTPDEEALLNRCVIIDFTRFNYTKEQSAQFNKMWAQVVGQRKGFGFLLAVCRSDVGKKILQSIQDLEREVALDKRTEGIQSRMIETYSMVYGAFSALYKDPVFKDFMESRFAIEEESFAAEVVGQINKIRQIVKSQATLRTFFSLFSTLFLRGDLERLAILLPTGVAPNRIRFKMQAVFDEVIAYDNRTKRALDQVGMSDISHHIRQHFEVKAKSDKLYGKNQSCYTLPLDEIEESFGVTFTGVNFDDEDDEMEQNASFDPEQIEKEEF